MSHDTEQWKDVPGYVLRYMVSDQGRVISFIKGFGQILKPAIVSGLFLVRLSDGAKVSGVYVHTAVLTAFVGPRPDGARAKRLNKQPGDNRLANLEWGYSAENTPVRVLTDEEIEAITQAARAGMDPKEIARQYVGSENRAYALASHEAEEAAKVEAFKGPRLVWSR